MGDGRVQSVRERAATSPATSAGLFRSGLRSYLGTPELPGWSLASFRRERIAEPALGVVFALVEGGFVGVIADKVFQVHPMALALLTAAPMLGNLSSVFWARLAQTRRKVPLVVAMQGLLGTLLLAIAFVPEGPAGGIALVSIVVVSRLVIGGLITVRSIIWTHNYPGEMRARATSRMMMLAFLSMTVAGSAGGLALDANPQSFGWLYVGGLAFAAIAMAAFGGIRMRGEEEPSAAPVGAGERVGFAGLGAFRILRDDPVFARYLSWQFLLGTSNMMVEPIVVYVVSRELGASYTTSVALTFVVPLGLGVLGIPLWAAYIDRVHISEFRSRHSWLFVTSQLLTGIGILMGSLVWIAIGRAVVGIARGGGSLAWQIGHNDFAHPDRAGTYMGVHQTLTGIRGAFAPFLGMALYLGFLGVPGLGGWTLIVATGASTIAALGFLSLHRRVREG